MGQNADFLHRWFDEVWNQGRADTIDELFAPEAVFHGLLTGDLQGRSAYRRFHRSFNATFADTQIAIDRAVEDADHVSAWCTVTATHRASGMPVTFTGAVMGAIRDGMVQEGWNSFDFLSVCVQLGALDAQDIGALLGA